MTAKIAAKVVEKMTRRNWKDDPRELENDERDGFEGFTRKHVETASRSFAF